MEIFLYNVLTNYIIMDRIIKEKRYIENKRWKGEVFYASKK